jgi:hypothetical protein
MIWICRLHRVERWWSLGDMPQPGLGTVWVWMWKLREWGWRYNVIRLFQGEYSKMLDRCWLKPRREKKKILGEFKSTEPHKRSQGFVSFLSIGIYWREFRGWKFVRLFLRIFFAFLDLSLISHKNIFGRQRRTTVGYVFLHLFSAIIEICWWIRIKMG